MSSSIPSGYPKVELGVYYSEKSLLNTVDIHILRPYEKKNPSDIWVIYIHGGAWRDPHITSSSVVPTIEHLSTLCVTPPGSRPEHSSLETKPPTTKISSPPQLPAAVVSLNYRLSPYPTHPSHPSQSSEVDPARNIVHPGHIQDVMDGIAYLQRGYGFGENYLLVGHSCGATLGMQVCMNREGWKGDNGDVQMPRGLVGLEGIYDLRLLRDTHTEHPVYDEILEGAFGPDRDGEWDKASPAQATFNQTWMNAEVVILGHSSDDELVDEVQVESMAKKIEEERFGARRLQVLKLRGSHDEIWREGREAARAVIVALAMLEL